MAIGNIVVADATTPTPVNHTFVPIADGADARYVNEAGAQTLAGQETLRFNVKRASDGKAPNSVQITIWDPKEVADGTLYKVSHGNSADMRFNFAQASTVQERLDIITMAEKTLVAMKTQIAAIQPQI